MTVHTGGKGFTIIELVIVIVIMGILGLIVFAAYNGITQRGYALKYIAMAEQFEKVIRLYYIQHGGTIPTTGGTPICFGNSAANFPATSTLPAGRCGVVTVNTIFGPLNSISDYDATYMSIFPPDEVSLPDGNLPYLDFSGVVNGVNGSVKARGLSFVVDTSQIPTHVRAWYYIPANEECGRSDATWLSYSSTYGACQLDFDLST